MRRVFSVRDRLGVKCATGCVPRSGAPVVEAHVDGVHYARYDAQDGADDVDEQVHGATAGDEHGHRLQLTHDQHDKCAYVHVCTINTNTCICTS